MMKQSEKRKLLRRIYHMLVYNETYDTFDTIHAAKKLCKLFNLYAKTDARMKK